MIGRIMQVLVDWAYSKESRRCPYAIVMNALEGDGTIIERCDLREHHRGPHRVTHGGTTNGHDPVTVMRIEWRTVAYPYLFEVLREARWETGDSATPKMPDRMEQWRN